MQALSVHQIRMLAVLTLVWGVNWPVMKYAVGQYPPISFRTISMVLGVMMITLIAKATGQSLAVPRKIWGRLLILAIPNMVLWHVFCVLAVRELSSGRAAILAYTMPVWAVLSGLMFGQRMSGRAWLGIGFALAGALLLLSGEFANLAGRPTGAVYMLIAASSWGFGTALLRHWPTGLSTVALTNAMLWITSAFMLVVMLAVDGSQWHWPVGVSQWWPIAYNAIGVFAFCHLAWFSLAANLPPVASGLSVMLIPVVGVFSGMYWLNEVPHWQDYAALGLILLSMAIVLLKPAAKA